MDQIPRQIRDEIESLQELLRESQNRVLATQWTEALLDPFEKHEPRFEPSEKGEIVAALDVARNRFGVNGVLADRIDAILARHASLPNRADQREEKKGGAELVSSDPTAESDTTRSGLEATGEGAADLFSGPVAAGEKAFEPLPDAFPTDEEALLDSQRVAAEDVVANPLPGVSTPESRESPPAAEEDRSDGEFSGGGAAGGRAKAPVDIFSDRISLEDALACLDVEISEADAAAMQQKLQNRYEDGVIQALQNHDQAEGRYILLPRVSSFTCAGQTVACTLKNLVKLYTRLFGSVRDLVPYRGTPLLDSETPEDGWAIIPHESAMETLGKNYAEQNHCMRVMGLTVGLPSHVVRRRTLVEAVYDMIVSRLVLNIAIQERTADWTSSSAGKTDHSTAFFAEEGIRIRDFARSSRHGGLGCCPTW